MLQFSFFLSSYAKRVMSGYHDRVLLCIVGSIVVIRSHKPTAKCIRLKMRSFFDQIHGDRNSPDMESVLKILDI